VAIDKYSILMERNISRLADVTHNAAKQEEIAKKTVEFNENVSAFKGMMYNIKNNDAPTKPASEFYANVVIQSAIDLATLKFAHREIINNGPTNVCEFFPYLPSDLEIQGEINVVNFNIGNVNAEPPVPILPAEIHNKRTTAKTTRTKRTSPKNKTVSKKATNNKDITHILDELFQTLIIEDRLATIRPSELYKLIEDTYKIPDVRDNYRSIIKNYLGVRMEEWDIVREEMVETAYNMMQKGIPRGQIMSQLNIKKKDPPIKYEKYKRIIDEMMQRYETLLDSVPDTELKPRPEWPTAI
jgi:hypothetical protein